MKKNLGFLFIVIFIIELCLLQFMLTLLVYLGNLPQNSSLHFRYILTVSMYICIAACLYKERKNLKNFHLDQMSLISLILANFFLVIITKLRFSNSIYPFIFGMLGLFTLVIAVKNWKSVPEASWRGLLFGIILTALVLIPTTYLSYLSQKGGDIISVDFWDAIIRSTLPTFAQTAVGEEIIFRGFLWGYLKQIGLASHKALFLQGVVFWLLHLSSLSFLPAFLISIPLVTIIYSLLAKYTKQVFPSIVSHAAYDTLVPLIWRLFAH
jgi:membrane protease YdiL (CAAX protease family)